MNDYYEVRIDLKPCTEDTTDLLAAMLADIGYESFLPDEDGITAYVKADDYDERLTKDAIKSLTDSFNPLGDDSPCNWQVGYSATLVEGQDWNAEWEKNYFQPIVVGGDCVIHSSFHTDAPKAKYEIVIDPKMAFGTGHHSTTSLIIKQLLAMDLIGKSVIDMGTGTGILAILAAMRGAAPVTAIEIDAFAYDNAVDNVASNGHPEINVINGDASALTGIEPCDLFIANINRNIILGDLQQYALATKNNGTMLLSGFYESDIPMLEAEADKWGLIPAGKAVGGEPEHSGTGQKEHWSCLILKKIDQ